MSDILSFTAAETVQSDDKKFHFLGLRRGKSPKLLQLVTLKACKRFADLLDFVYVDLKIIDMP